MSGYRMEDLMPFVFRGVLPWSTYDSLRAVVYAGSPDMTVATDGRVFAAVPGRLRWADAPAPGYPLAAVAGLLKEAEAAVREARYAVRLEGLPAVRYGRQGRSSKFEPNDLCAYAQLDAVRFCAWEYSLPLLAKIARCLRDVRVFPGAPAARGLLYFAFAGGGVGGLMPLVEGAGMVVHTIAAQGGHAV